MQIKHQKIISIANILNGKKVTTIPWHLAKEISKDENYDLNNIVINNFYSSLLILAGRNHIVNNSDILHTHHTFSSIIISLFKAINSVFPTNKYFVHTLHRNFNSFPLLYKAIYIILIIPFRDKIICNSVTTLKSLPKFLIANNPNKYTVIYNGLVRRNFTKKATSKSSVINLINVARMIKIKDQKTILLAVQLLISRGQKVKLIFCGDGPEMQNLKNLCSNLGITDNVTFTGMINGDQVYDNLRNSDISITSSINEGFGVSTIEGMDAGVLVLATDIEIHREIIGDSDLLFCVSDFNSLVDLIIKYTSCSDLYNRKVSDNPNKVANFDIKLTTDKYKNIYYKLVNR